jgi:hypothetical protein
MLKSHDISLLELKKIAIKEGVITSGTKSFIALTLFKLRAHTLSTINLEKIFNLLPRNEKKAALLIIDKQKNIPITNYKGLWKPKSKSISKMTRKEMIREIRIFRNAWEKLTGKSQDLSDERLNNEIDKNLREHLKFYYSKASKNIAANFLRDS